MDQFTVCFDVNAAEVHAKTYVDRGREELAAELAGGSRISGFGRDITPFGHSFWVIAQGINPNIILQHVQLLLFTRVVLSEQSSMS
jgi:hypothetical protein